MKKSKKKKYIEIERLKHDKWLIMLLNIQWNSLNCLFLLFATSCYRIKYVWTGCDWFFFSFFAFAYSILIIECRYIKFNMIEQTIAYLIIQWDWTDDFETGNTANGISTLLFLTKGYSFSSSSSLAASYFCFVLVWFLNVVNCLSLV